MRSGALAARPASPRRVGLPDRPGKAADRSKPDFSPNKKGQRPHPYQVLGVLWLYVLKYALLGDQVGLGKTCQALLALPRNARVIVVCPASVILTWLAQILLWRPDLHATYGEALRRPLEGEILIVSYDSLPDERLLEPLRDVYLIGDEIQACKADSAQRTQKFRRLRSQCRSCWGLSATPMLGNPEDLWGVLFTLNLTHIFPGGRREFIELCGGKPRFCRVRGQLRRIGFEWGEVSPEVRERLKTVMLRRLADDVLDDLPEKQEIDIPVECPVDLRPFLTKVKEAWDRVGANDMPPFELLSEAMAALARSKIAAAKEHVDNMASADMPLLVFSAHVDPVLEMRKLKGAGAFVGTETLKERRHLVDKFQAGDLRILAMTIKTGGAGLNLQKAGGVFFIDRAYTPGDNEQAYGRARRQGNVHHRVPCWRMISDHPLDRHLSDILDRKIKMITAAVG